MAFSQSFSITTNINPAIVTLTDTSVGSDPNIVSRVVFLYEVDQTLLTGASISWPYSQSSTSLSVLTQDVALNIVVQWLDSIGSVLYQSSKIYAFTGYSEQFYYGLTQNQTSSPNIVNDTRYYGNKSKLRDEIDSAIQAIDVGSDIYSAQNCLIRAIYLITNQALYF